MRPKGSAEELEHRRQRAIVLVLEHGYSSSEAAEAVGVQKRAVNRWLASYRDDGKEGIAAQPTTGRPPSLGDKEIAKLEKILLKGPIKAGFENDLWTCHRVQTVIEETFGIEFHRSHVWRLLQQMEWTPQKPEKRAIERDEKGIERFIRTEWKKIVKKPRKAMPP